MPLDRLRGLVVVLMAIDHASMFMNAGRISADTALLYRGEFLPLGQMVTRWVAHLCAPSFVFLAGAAIAVSAARRAARGQPMRSFDKDLVIRGVILMVLDVTVISAIVGVPHMQVLFAIGAGLVLMAPLRRLPPSVLLVMALAWLAVGEAVTLALWDPAAGNPGWVTSILVGVRVDPTMSSYYPVIPWLSFMLLGFVAGRWLASGVEDRVYVRTLLVVGAAGLGIYLALRGLNGYGNMALPRLDGSLAQWLHVGKYPPSLVFAAMELGLMAWILAGLFWLEARVRLGTSEPLVVFGQTALYFYAFHQVILRAIGVVVGKVDLAGTFLAALVCLVVSYPFCRAYRTFKSKHPRSLIRYF
jgi:uncharacterized membrane protein